MSDYLEVPTNPVICRRCGALVDVAFTLEHDRFHNDIDAKEATA